MNLNNSFWFYFVFLFIFCLIFISYFRFLIFFFCVYFICIKLLKELMGDDEMGWWSGVELLQSDDFDLREAFCFIGQTLDGKYSIHPTKTMQSTTILAIANWNPINKMLTNWETQIHTNTLIGKCRWILCMIFLFHFSSFILFVLFSYYLLDMLDCNDFVIQIYFIYFEMQFSYYLLTLWWFFLFFVFYFCTFIFLKCKFFILKIKKEKKK